MLEIFVLFKVGQAINRRATSKGWPGWPFVILLVIMYICCAISGVVAVVVLSDKGGNGNGDDSPFEFIIGYALGAIAGAVASYFIVLILPDRSEPVDDYNRDRTRRLRDGDEDDEDRPRRFRDRDNDTDDRDGRYGRRADDDDWRRR